MQNKSNKSNATDSGARFINIDITKIGRNYGMSV